MINSNDNTFQRLIPLTTIIAVEYHICKSCSDSPPPLFEEEGEELIFNLKNQGYSLQPKKGHSPCTYPKKEQASKNIEYKPYSFSVLIFTY